MLPRSLRPRLLLLALLAVVTAPLGHSQPAASAPAPTAAESRRTEAQRFLATLRTDSGTPAVSAAVARDGEIVFSGGAGVIDLEHDAPATGSSVYNIGSVSKAITAVAVLQLVEAGKVSLDDDVRKYVPVFPDKGATITLRHLLTHTSGIRHYADGDFPGTPANENMLPVTSYRDALPVFADDPLLFSPGRYYFYTSYGLNLLEGVVEAASGQRFEDYLRARVFEPAGMTTAAVDDPERIVPGRARSYRIEDGRTVHEHYGDVRYKIAGGGLIASAEDLARFGAALNDGRLLGPEAREQMFTEPYPGLEQFVPDGSPRPLRGFRQALGWRLRTDDAGRRVVYHCGSVKSFNACLVDFVDEDLVAVTASNSWQCCGWGQTDELAGRFRKASEGR